MSASSKARAMTGWRAAPASVMGELAKLGEDSASYAPSFVQAAGEVAQKRGWTVPAGRERAGPTHLYALGNFA
ncbi:hypothetical protein [Burkholderia ubonensis]|uniref:hypothetical protein n=1 Tax=Burkholderia ubonensis TaxID=101571 RepID=UPI0019D4AA96